MPGHSTGHICLYEPDHKFLFSGDHILDDITPNITPWPGIADSLGLYLQSLDKVEAMDIDTVLPGHRSVMYNYRQRIKEIRHHHQVRLDEILSILAGHPGNAYQVAGQMKWDLSYESWDEFPGFQKWFATGEAMAHLEHLLHLNKVMTDITSGQIIYRLT
jgi:glyoxylase-like metal-dependent hydrolase (beta-lactamase superfamily II)